ncbi:COP1-interactive protein 1 [Linum perenne]
MEKDHLSEKIKDLILEMEALGSQKNNFEEELRTRVEEIASLKDEMLGLHGKVSGMDQTISERGLEFSVLHEKHASRETEHMSLKEHANNLQQELDSLQKERSELQSQLESQQKEFSAKMTEIENQKSELATQVADLQKLLDEQTEAYKKLSDDYKQVEALYEESKANAEAAEKKAEDFSKQVSSMDQSIAELLDTIESQKRDLEFKGDELRSLADKNNNIQVKLRLSSQKGRVTDQLLSEHEETFRKEEAKYKEKQRELEARISTLSITNEAHRKMVTDLSDKIHSNITGLDTLSSRFHEDCDRYQHRILEMSCEIQIAKSWVVDMNKQMENLNKEANSSALQLQHTRQQESALKIAVEELQAKASKEETEKQNLTKAIQQLENKVAAMETSMKEKDEGMFHLGEQKREAYWVPVSVSTTQRINTKTISQLI